MSGLQVLDRVIMCKSICWRKPERSISFSYISVSNKSHAHQLPFFSHNFSTVCPACFWGWIRGMVQTRRNLIYFRVLYSVNSQPWCITDALNCSGSPQPQNYTAAVGFRFNRLWSILDDTIRAALKQNGIGYKKLNNPAHTWIHPFPPESLNQMHSYSGSPADSLTPTDF